MRASSARLTSRSSTTVSTTRSAPAKAGAPIDGGLGAARRSPARAPAGPSARSAERPAMRTDDPRGGAGGGDLRRHRAGADHHGRPRATTGSLHAVAAVVGRRLGPSPRSPPSSTSGGCGCGSCPRTAPGRPGRRTRARGPGDSRTRSSASSTATTSRQRQLAAPGAKRGRSVSSLHAEAHRRAVEPALRETGHPAPIRAQQGGPERVAQLAAAASSSGGEMTGRRSARPASTSHRSRSAGPAQEILFRPSGYCKNRAPDARPA